MRGDIDWIKVNVNSFDDNKIRLISSMPQGDSVICIWFRLLFEAGKSNDEGYVYINEFIPYTCEMLGKLFNRSVKKIQYAIDTLKRFMMIEVDDDNFIKIKNWNKYQSVDKLESIRESGKERTRRCRARKKAEMEATKLQKAQEQYYNNDKDEATGFRYNGYNDHELETNNEVSYAHSYSNASHIDDFEDKSLEAAVDYEEINKGNLLRGIEESDYPEELKYKNSNGRCNVTCNNGNVTVTDKIKKDIEIQTIDVEEEKDRDVDKETNIKLNLSNNVTQNVNERYAVTDNKALQKRDGNVANNVLCQFKTKVENLECNSSKGIDQIIEEIMEKNNYGKHSSMDIAYAMHVFYGNYTENEEWLKVNDIRRMLIEHDWRYVKTAIEIVIAAGTFELRYVDKLLTKWKDEGYPKAV